MAENITPEQLADRTADDIPKEFQEAFTKVVKAGMKVMYSEETHDMMLDELEKEGPIEQRIGESIAGLMGVLFQKSNQSMPPEVIVPAATFLLAKGADFLEKVTGEPLTPEVLAGSVEVMVNALAQQFGIDPAQLSTSMQQGAEQMAQGEQAPAEEPVAEVAPAEGAGGLINSGGI